MRPALKEQIENTLGAAILNTSEVSGGDSSQAYKITTKSGHFFCKYHSGVRGFQILKAEKEGLEAIAESETIRTPQIYYLGSINKGGVLILEYIEAKAPTDRDMEHLGRGLADLHKLSSHAFGWHAENFIGSLDQKNGLNSSWPAFYVENRLLPQLALAVHKGLLRKEDVPGKSVLLISIKKHCIPVRPSLIHGDLWGGNYLIDKLGVPVLIDPSVCYADPGIDLAMSALFGGFSATFYKAYSENSPTPMPSKAVIDLYQLYYLLVHLNLFGDSYAPAVRRTLKSYFQEFT